MNIKDKLREIFLYETKERVIETKNGRILKRYLKPDSFLQGYDIKEIRKIVYKDYTPHPKDIAWITKEYAKIQRKRKKHKKAPVKKVKKVGKLVGWLNKTGSRIYTKHFIIPSYIYTIVKTTRVNFSDKQIVSLLVEFLKERFPSMKNYTLLWIQKKEVRE